jgi:hypothetical protein
VFQSTAMSLLRAQVFRRGSLTLPARKKRLMPNIIIWAAP